MPDNPMSEYLVVVDIDGTLAKMHPGRIPLMPPRRLRHLTHAWRTYDLAAHMDEPVTGIIRVIAALSLRYPVVLLTSRNEISRAVTTEWLAKQEMPYTRLIMRPVTDNRPAAQFKEATLREIGLNNILCCFDDDPCVVAHLRKLGLMVFQVDGEIYEAKQNG